MTYLTFRNFFKKNYSTHKIMAIKACLIDLSGTLHIEDEPTENAIAALERLRQKNVKIKFVTNTTKESTKSLYERLCKIGFKLEQNEIYSSLSATVNYVSKNQLNPFYILTKDALKDFPPPNSNSDFDSVVIGLAPEEMNYNNLNIAFRLVMKNCPLIAIHQGKYYKQPDGLSIGPGCFIKGLEYSTGKKSIVVGKPNKYFFENAIPEGVLPEECVMIGDDFNDDIVGGMAIGMKGVLVKTGKYLPNVVLEPAPTKVVDNFSKFVDLFEKDLIL